MKGLFHVLLLLSACALCACGQGNGTAATVPDPEPEPGKGELTVSLRGGGTVTSFDLPCAAFSEVLVVRSDRPWNVEVAGGETAWLTVEPTSGATAAITVAVHTGEAERKAQIRFSTTDGTASVELPVRQRGSELFGAAPIRDLLLVPVDDPDKGPGPDREELAKLVAAEIDGNPAWLFDGFVFTGSYIHGRSFMATGSHRATLRQDWLEMLERLFADGESIPALEEALEAKRGSIPGAFHRRNVVIFMPDPQAGQTDWGELDGQPLDFNTFEDRITACKWYVDRVLERFAICDFRNIRLAGFYWLTENGGFLPHHLSRVAEHIHDKGLAFYWIPYYGAYGHDRWTEYGFDRAWYQPNYLFESTATLQRLADAWEEARGLGMSIEVEFDANYPLERNADYVDAYEQFGLFDSLDLAYYGARALGYWQEGVAPERAFFRRIAGIIAERQKNFYNR